MAKGTTATKGKASKKTEAAAPAAEDLELDEVDGEDVEEKPSKKGGQEEVTFGASDLAKLLSEKSGKTVTTRELRTLIRKMARDGSGRVNREIKAGNRTRYNWSGPKDPEVKAIIAAFDSGELEADKKAKLEELKTNKAKKKAAEEAKASKKGKKSTAAKETEDDDLDLDDDE